MKIEILGTESLGVRGMCCLVTIGNRKILIDPGIALGYTRHGLLPHSFQVAMDEKIQDRIVDAWSSATDIVISHFHGDHIASNKRQPISINNGRNIISESGHQGMGQVSKSLPS